MVIKEISTVLKTQPILHYAGAEHQVTRTVELRLAQLPLHPEQGAVHRMEAAAGRQHAEGGWWWLPPQRGEERGPGCLQICPGQSESVWGQLWSLLPYFKFVEKVVSELWQLRKKENFSLAHLKS